MKQLMKYWSFCLLLAVLLWTSARAVGRVEALYITCDLRENGIVAYSMAVSMQFDSVTKSVTLPLAGDEISGLSVNGGKGSLKTDDGWSRMVLDSQEGFIGRQTFVVSYQTAARSAGKDWELPLVSSRWEQDVAEFSFDLHLPQALETEPLLNSGYSGELPGAAVRTASGCSGQIESGLMAHEAITLLWSLPEDYFYGTGLRSLLRLDWGLAALLVLVLVCVLYWLRRLHSHRAPVTSRVLPPEGWTPAEVPMILDGSQPKPAANLPLWGQLGYVYVDFAGSELVLGEQMQMGSERPAHEAAMHRTLFEGRRELWLPDQRFTGAEAAAAHNAGRLWRARLFDRQGGNPRLLALLAAVGELIAVPVSLAVRLPAGAGWTLLVIFSAIPGAAMGLLAQHGVSRLRQRPWLHSAVVPGLLAAVLLLVLTLARPLCGLTALALQIFAGWVLAFGGRRTAAGAEALAQLLGLRRFLQRASRSRLQELLSRDPSYVQTVMPYAIELGLASHVAAQLGKFRLEEPGWLMADEPINTAARLMQKEKTLLERCAGTQKTNPLRRRGE